MPDWLEAWGEGMSAVYEVYESVFGQGFLLLTDGQVHL